LIPTLIVHGLRGQLPPLVSPATARDFVYVDDAVDAMLLVAGAGRFRAERCSMFVVEARPRSHPLSPSRES